jgi:hypothetical protein
VFLADRIPNYTPPKGGTTNQSGFSAITSPLTIIADEDIRAPRGNPHSV